MGRAPVSDDWNGNHIIERFDELFLGEIPDREHGSRFTALSSVRRKNLGD